MKIIERLKNNHRLSRAVKEALDNLPSAVCYFTTEGYIKLCNTAMYNLYRKMTKKELQSLEELKATLDNCEHLDRIIRDGNIFAFNDGTAWLYSEKRIKTEENRIYTEIVFSDVTELYNKRKELEHQSIEMKEMYREIRLLQDNLLEETREQEILNLKSRLHDQMNIGVTAIRQILRHDITSEENSEAIAQFRRAIRVLKEDTVYAQDDLSEFVQDAAMAGVSVKISGEMPKDAEVLKQLIGILREACINAARHADATILYIESDLSEELITLNITNNGNAPDKEISLRGGLADIKRRLEKAGGSLTVESNPQFRLMVTLPVSK